MLKKLYLDNGYLNFKWVFDKGYPYTFIVGAKSIGKTYGILKYVLDNDIKFIYMRRTQNQLDAIKNPEDSPFKTINMNTYYNVYPQSISKSLVGFYNAEYNEEEGVEETYGKPLGYGLALSTFQNISSVGFSDVDMLIYDEFIPMRHERAIRDEATVFFKLIDNIGRNRELEGKKPLQVICLANSDRLDNAIFSELGLTDIARKNRDELYYDDDRGILLIQPKYSPITEMKKDTAISKLTKGTRFYDLAINNEFDVDESLITDMNLTQFKMLVQIDDFFIYRHKSEQIYYVTHFEFGNCKDKYDWTTRDVSSFLNKYRYLIRAYINKKVFFENYAVMTKFLNYAKIN